MANVLSEPIENLIQDQPCEDFEKSCEKRENKKHCDVLIVGSGYGGAIAAMRLADKETYPDRLVYVFERGKEYTAGDFPESLGDLPGHVQFLAPGRTFPTGYADALFDFRIGDPISVLVGNGLGGTSLINANVALEPDEFSNPAWPAELHNKKGGLQQDFDAVKKLLGVNTDNPFIQKLGALSKLADSLKVPCHKAPIAVTSNNQTTPVGPVRNSVGIEQNPCVGCANCVTGCNVGSKNTLPMNALPLAKSRGAKLYTGATVLSVEPADDPDGSRGWLVRFRRTATSKTVMDGDVFTLHARIVILAAGTLGSTEILLRSQARDPDKVKFSNHLGSRFSTNGDVLAFGYAQKQEVNAVAHADFADKAELRSKRGIGPTITGMFTVKTDSGPVTIEDGAIPSALAHLFGEVITTASLPQRFVKDDAPAWFRNTNNRDKDPLAVHPDALRHSQVLLGMGDDEAPWELKLPLPGFTTTRDYDRATVRVQKQDVPKESVFHDIDQVLKQAEQNHGFDGGDYLPNPLWKLMPDEMAQASKVPAPGGQLVSVHPLGGCPMGDDVESGVVNHYGQVFFKPDTQKKDPQPKDRIYNGLYVMDGAIIPCGLGVNPFLTIAALAYRNAGEVAHVLGQQPQQVGAVSATIKKDIEQTLPKIGTDPEPALGHRVEAKFTEWMVGRITGREVPDWLIERLGSPKHPRAGQEAIPGELNQSNKLVMRGEIDFPNVLLWLREPNIPLAARAKLFWHRKQGETVVNEDQDLIELADGDGTVELLAWDRPGFWMQAWRALLAGMAFFIRRTKEFITNPPAGHFRDTWRVACSHANWREMRYRFSFTTTVGKNLTLQGTKLLAYAPTVRNPWVAAGELPITLSTDEGDSVKGVLRVDVVRLTQRAPFQVQKSPSTPVTIAAMASAGMMMLRVLFQTHFWSFGAPDYPMESPIGNRDPGRVWLDPGLVWLTWVRRKSRSIKPEGKWFWVPVSQSNPQLIPLRLIRYQPEQVTHGSILIIHGLATSSLAFATDTIDVNLATYFCREGYDVWLLDYRLSIALPYALQQWTMDQIAHSDMPEAVKYVYKETGRPIQVFAHCIGAGCLAMAILNGRCHDTAYVHEDGHKGRSMIGALVTHAVHPWMVPSVANHLKINLATIFSDAINLPFFDSVVPDEANVQPADVLLDRIAGSLPSSFSSDPWLGGLLDGFLHRFMTDKRKGKEICKRLSLFYGYEWWHKNLAWETHKGIANLLGVVNLETVRQIYFILFRRRLTTRSGYNEYVRRKNFDDFWTFPTLFGHGRDSQLYDPISAVGSCLRLRELRKLNGKYPASEYDVYWLEVPDCGHMDFLFGKNAETKVYPHLDAFYKLARAPKTGQAPAPVQQRWNRFSEPSADRDPFWDRRKTPAYGPIIGWVRPDDQDANKVKLRIWVEPYVFSAITAYGNTVPPPRGIEIDFCRLPDGPTYPLPRVTHRAAVPRAFVDPDDPGTVPDYPGRYWIYDLTMPRTFGRNSNDPKDLQLSIDYSDPADIKLKIEIVLPNERVSAAPELHVPEEGVRIPLSGLPWFQHLCGDRAAGASFLVGSCRYTGSPFDEDLADSIFEAMCKQVYHPGVDHVLLVGDQIYADATADMFDTRELREHFSRRYREAFGAPHLRRLLASVPTYMALDDHEFDDNWPGNAQDLLKDNDPVVQRSMELFWQGLAAVKAYQWGMSQRDGQPKGWSPSHDDQGLWHTFESGGLPFFVMDTRTERTLRQARISSNAAHAQLVGKRQFDTLTKWLCDAPSEKPKFIVSGSVLAPVPRNFTGLEWMYRSNDDWAGYPATWRSLVKYIVERQIQNVVFIAGDYHLSALAKLTLNSDIDGKKPVTAYSIVASGLFAPLPFANSKCEDYEWGTPTKLPFSAQDATIEVEPYLLTTNSSHFLRVDANYAGGSKWEIVVSVYDRTGILGPEMAVKPPFQTVNNVVRWTL